MDFSISQNSNTRFMYVLPIAPNKALFEYTLFSKDVLPKEEYERELQKYLASKSITEYTIIEKEKGIIPMTSYRFWKENWVPGVFLDMFLVPFGILKGGSGTSGPCSQHPWEL